MANDTWGDVIARGYSAGRAIGNDFSSMRLSRKAAKIRDEYEQRAQQEDKPLSEYMPEIEQRLQQAAIDSGMTRRGIEDRYGRTPDSIYADTIGGLATTDYKRRAGAKALAGDQVAARDVLARGAYSMADFDTGQTQQIAGRTIANTQAAKNPDGSINKYGMAKGMAGIAADYGDAAGAVAADQQASTFRLQAAVPILESLGQQFQKPESTNPDRVRGTVLGLKEFIPEAAHMDIQVNDEGQWNIYQYGKPTGWLDPKNPEDVQTVMGIVTGFSRAPGEYLKQYQDALASSITEEKTRRSDIDKQAYTAMFDVAKELAQDSGIQPSELLKAVGADSGGRSGGGGGWQTLEIGDQPNTYIMQKGGNVYRVRTNVPPDPRTGSKGAPVMVETLDGKPVPGSVLSEQSMSELQDKTAILSTALKGNFEDKARRVNGALQLVNQIRTAALGGGGAAPQVGGGQAQGIPYDETRGYVNNILGKVGPLSGSNREKAKQLLPALVQQESGGNPTAVSPKGARGLTQVMPSTGADPGLGVTPMRDRSDQEYLRFGEDYLTALLDRYNGDPVKALAAYNAGLGTVDKWDQGGVFGGGGQTAAIPVNARQPAPAAGASAPVSPAAPPVATAGAPKAIPTTRTPRLSPDTLLENKRKYDMLLSRAEAAAAALDRFDRDMGTRKQVAPGSDALPVRVVMSGLTPAQQRARERLAAEAEALNRQAAEAERALRTDTRGLRAQTKETLTSREAENLYSRYSPGMADFVKALK